MTVKPLNDDIRRAVRSILADSRGVETVTAWNNLQEHGFTLVGVPLEHGGAGGTLGDLAEVLREVGHSAVPLPVAETALAAWCLSSAGEPVPRGILGVDTAGEGETAWFGKEDTTPCVCGHLEALPYAPLLDHLVIVELEGSPGSSGVGRFTRSLQTVQPVADRCISRRTLADDPIDDVVFGEDGAPLDGTPVPWAVEADRIVERQLLFTAQLMVGAAERVVALTAEYARMRHQFGRPIARFQAVQQMLAVLTGTVRQASAITDLAFDRLSAGVDVSRLALAVRICVDEAAGTTARIGHQIHGAVGVTDEYELHRLTTRLLSWREYNGSTSDAAQSLGQRVAAGSGADLWRMLVDG